MKVWKWFLVFAATGLILRLAIAFTAIPLFRSDSLEYNQFAENLVKEHEYYLVYQSRQPALQGMVVRSFRPPGYPFFLALVYEVFGIHIRPVLVIQALLDFVSALFIYGIARNWLKPKYALWAFFGYSIYVVWASMFMTEGFFNFLQLFTLWVLLGKRRQSRLWMALVGIGFGWFVLTKPEKVLLVPIFLGYVLWKDRSRRALLNCFICGLFMTLVLAPWLWREKEVHGKWIWIEIGGGKAWFDGSYIPLTSVQIYAKARQMGMNELEMDQLFSKVTMEYFKRNPGHYLRAGWNRVLHLWDLRTDTVIQRWFLYPLVRREDLTGYILAYIGYFMFILSRVVVVLGLAGAAVNSRKFRELAIFYAVPVMITALHFAAFYGSARYLASAYFCFCIFFAFFLRWYSVKTGREKNEESN
jgi:4-amino-4-deoxy-L-arabinose transferase-like glycosyltransferase